MDAQHSHYANKLACDIDWRDLSVAIAAGDGVGCNASTKGAPEMSRLGFRVKELIGGLDWWKRDGHPTSSGEATDVAGECGCN